MIHLFRAQQTRGFQLTIVPAEDDLSVRTDRFLDAIDDTAGVARALPYVVRHGRCRDRLPRARSGRQRDPRYLSVRRDRAGRRGRARRGLRRWRLSQMAVRRAGQRVSVYATRSARWPAAVLHRLAGTSKAVRVRHRPGGRRGSQRRCDGNDERDAIDSGVLRSTGRTRHRPRGECRPNPQAVEAADRATTRARRRTRLLVRGVARSRAPRRHRRRQRPRRAARGPHAQGTRLPRRLQAAGWRAALTAFLQHGRRSRSDDERNRVDRRAEGLRHARTALGGHVSPSPRRPVRQARSDVSAATGHAARGCRRMRELR